MPENSGLPVRGLDKLNPLMVMMLYMLTGGMVGGGTSLAVVHKMEGEILNLKSSVQSLRLAGVDIKSEHRSIWTMIEGLKEDRTSCRSDIKDLNSQLRGQKRHERH